jgi:hypothetical protein
MRRLLLLSCSLVLTARCATIAHGRFQDVPVTSDPAGATVSVHCGDSPPATSVTPTTVKLRRNAPGCSITLAKSGFAKHVITFDRKISGWFWANFAFPGILTEVIVEAATGPPLFPVDDNPSSRNHQLNGVGLAAGAGLAMWIDHSTGAQYDLRPARVDATLAK